VPTQKYRLKKGLDEQIHAWLWHSRRERAECLSVAGQEAGAGPSRRSGQHCCLDRLRQCGESSAGARGRQEVNAAPGSRWNCKSAARIMGVITTVYTRTAPHLQQSNENSERMGTGKIVPSVESRVNKKSGMGPEKREQRRLTYLRKALANTEDLF
jgi:hypothetical protein